MLGTGALIRAAPKLRLAMAARQMSVISGPPQVKISFAEKVVHGLVISVSILSLPLWILANIKNYKSRD